MMWDVLARKPVFAPSCGGQETLHKPPQFTCAALTHEPFRLMNEPVQLDAGAIKVFWGVVSTTGDQFQGDRTDIHDGFSLMWGAVLRAFGLSSVWLIDEPHGFVPGEIGARHLIFQQCPWNISRVDFETAKNSMNAWSAYAFHLLDDVFKWDRGSRIARREIAAVQQTEPPDWADQICTYLRYPKDVTISRRRFPLWVYFSSQKRGVTIIRMPKIRISFLKVALAPFAPESTKGEKAFAIFANGIPNAVPYTLEKRACKLLSLIGDQCQELLVVPLDSHCLFIGDRTIVALRGECGREIFEREREIWTKRRSNDNKVFFSDSVVEWKREKSPGDFEDLCLELVKREPGVLRAKSVGSVNDRDGGRDIIIDWKIPDRHANPLDATFDDEFSSGGTITVRVIGQIKIHEHTIGKRHVQDIRDTLERYGAKGFLLIAFPRISSALVDYLEDLRKRTGVFAEWWEKRDIEYRLRRHPDIAQRYQELLALRLLSYD